MELPRDWNTGACACFMVMGEILSSRWRELKLHVGHYSFGSTRKKNCRLPFRHSPLTDAHVHHQHATPGSKWEAREATQTRRLRGAATAYLLVMYNPCSHGWQRRGRGHEPLPTTVQVLLMDCAGTHLLSSQIDMFSCTVRLIVITPRDTSLLPRRRAGSKVCS